MHNAMIIYFLLHALWWSISLLPVTAADQTTVQMCLLMSNSMVPIDGKNQSLFEKMLWF
jgi:hypothetical protein